MPRVNARLCLSAFAFAVALTAAQDPFAGTWKLNQSKSKFTGEIVKYEKKPSGAMLESSGGIEFEFKIDGTEYPFPLGGTVSWKQGNDRAWVSVYRLKGKELSTTRLTLSADGRTLTATSTGTRPNGEAFKNVFTGQRIAGGPGLPGAWKSTEVKISAPGTFQIAAPGPNALTFSSPEYQFLCKAQLDGKDYPATGPTVPEGFSMSVKRIGPRQIEYVDKYKGKPIREGVMAVSADGRTLTEDSWPVGMKQEKVTAVYEK
jgi:hypothetical protein